MDDGSVLEQDEGSARSPEVQRKRDLTPLLSALTLWALLPAVAFAQSADVYVKADATGANDGTSWEDAFTDLQDALDAALAGDEIWVARGTYRPSLPTHPEDPRSATFALMNDVALYGGFAGTETEREARDPARHVTALSGDLARNDGPDFENNGDNAYAVVTARRVDETAILDGFTVTAARGDAGIVIDSASPAIANCAITRNWSGGAAGVAIVSHSRPVLTGCTISFNDGGLDGGQGLRVDFEGAQAILIRCTFSRNRIGVGVSNFASVTLVDCVIEQNDHDGIVVGFRSSATLTGCTIAHNLGNSPPGPWQNHGVTVGSSSSAVLKSCLVWGNGRGSILRDADSAVEATYCCIEGASPFPGNGNINDDPLFCAAATEVRARSQSELEAALEFSSLGLSPDSPCIGSGEGGRNIGADTGICDPAEQGGRVIRLAPGTYSMDGVNLGQGVSLVGSRHEDGGETVLEGTVFGLRTGAVLSNLTVTGGETLGGIVVEAGESPEIRECRIAGNAASVGGGVRCDSGSSPVLINCVIAGNSATFGGGVYASEASPVLINCTIAGNSARAGSGLRGRNRSSFSLLNSIVWGNEGGAIDLTDRPGLASALESSYSLIEGDGVWPGEGNTNEDPLFAEDGSHRLRSGSPAIDAGTTEEAPSIDRDGNQRPCGAGTDLGAYEHCDGAPTPAVRFVRGDCDGDGRVGGQVGDAVFLLSHNFAGGAAPSCAVACDANGDGQIGGVGDALYLLNYGFGGGAPPPPPFPQCGPRDRPSDAALDCTNVPEACK